jgi:nicotinic acid phosphoribosyltransferase
MIMPQQKLQYPVGPHLRDFEMNSDSYKYSHWKFQDLGVTENYDYLTSRGGLFNDLTMFGAQAQFMKYMIGRRITPDSVRRTQKKLGRHFNNPNVFNYDAFMDIATRLDGRIPIRAWALPDGLSEIPVQTPLLTYVNTDPKHAAISGFLEPLKLQLWNPITIASLSQHIKKMIYKFLVETGTPEDIVWKLHNFGLRGTSSMESAEIGDAAHLVNFFGSDVVRTIDFINEFYSNGIFDDDGDPTYCPCFSVVATEHSVMTQRGPVGEPGLVKEIMQRYPTGILSLVGDSYNIFDFASKIIGTNLHTEVIERAGIVVIRPDCYDDQTEILTEKGFVPFSEYKSHPTSLTPVAQYHEDGSIDFVEPTKYYEESYEGPMYHFTNAFHIDLLVTPNHRMIRRRRSDQKIDVIKAEDAKYNFRWQHIHGGKLAGSAELSAIEKILIAFQADGSFNTTGPKTKIRFNFTKQRKVQRMTALCENAGVDYHTSVEPGRPQNVQFYITLPNEPSKDFEWVLEILPHISGDWAQAFIEEMSYWDATRRTEDRFKYDTTIAVNAEVVQTLATLAGYRTCYSIAPDERKEIFSDVHTVHVCLWDYTDGQSINVEQVPYKGKVYCVQVPSGMLIIRRNGKVSVCGNSGDPIPVMMKVMWELGEKFGWEINNKGYRVLGNRADGGFGKIKVLQGDKNDFDAIYNMLRAFKGAQWSADNIATFGMGGALLQASTRDTQKMAVKLSSMTKDGKWIDINKDPITDPGKGSKAGRFAVVYETNPVTGERRMVTKKLVQGEPEPEGNLLREIFRDGELLIHENFETVRARANEWMKTA